MTKLKVAFDASQTGGNKAGCGFYAAAVLDGLLAANTGLEVTLLTSFGDFYHDPRQALAFHYRKKGMTYGPRFLRREKASKYWDNKQKGGRFLDSFDVVHANNFWCPPWPIRSKLIYTLYDMSFIDHPEWSTKQNRRGCQEGVERAARYADEFVAISESTKQAFLGHFPDVDPDKIHVIYPACRFSQASHKAKPIMPRQRIFRSDIPFLLSTGTIEPRKNLVFLLEVYERFRNHTNSSMPLILAGKQGWLMDDFKERINKSPWAHDIHVLGYVGENELAWLYKNCHALLYPSHYEGFGLPVLESMSFGAPVICSNSTSLPEVVGKAGILLPPNALEVWVAAIKSIPTDSEMRKKMQMAAKEQASNFSWKKGAQLVSNLYGNASR